MKKIPCKTCLVETREPAEAREPPPPPDPPVKTKLYLSVINQRGFPWDKNNVSILPPGCYHLSSMIPH